MALVNFYPAFIDSIWNSAWESSRAERLRAHTAAAAPFRAAGRPVPHHVSNAVDQLFAARIPRPPLASLIAHFEHMVAVMGAGHVGIGTDFDGISALPEGIDSAADLPRITEALCADGHSAEDLHNILGGNLLRVFAEVSGWPMSRF